MSRIVEPVTSEEIRHKVSKPGSGRRWTIRENLLRPVSLPAQTWLSQWEGGWEDVDNFRPGLWLWGPSNTGKTWTALNLATLHPLNPEGRFIGKRWDTKRFVEDYQRKQWFEKLVLRDRSDSLWDQYTSFEMDFERLCWTDLLIMDEMYYWPQPDWLVGEIEYVLKSRLERGLATIMVSRDTPPELSILHDVLATKSLFVSSGR